MGFLREFREFAMKGNVVDMAVGVVIGGAFGRVVSSLVEKIFMPVVGALSGRFGDLSKLAQKIEVPGVATIEIGYGAFVSAIVDFTVVAFCLFLVIKAMNTAKKRFEKEQAATPPAAPPADVLLLTEIRDLLKNR